jgi:hypothetical protein
MEKGKLEKLSTTKVVSRRSRAVRNAELKPATKLGKEQAWQKVGWGCVTTRDLGWSLFVKHSNLGFLLTTEILSSSSSRQRLAKVGMDVLILEMGKLGSEWLSDLSRVHTQ